MINREMEGLGSQKSAIRELFEQGKMLKQKYGSDNVFDFSIGNPSIPCPQIVNDTLIDLVNIAKYMDFNEELDENENTLEIINKNIPYNNFNSTELHGYSSAPGDINVRKAISEYLNDKYNTNTKEDLIYLTTGAASALTISIKALTNNQNDEVIVFTPFFPEYAVFIKNSNAKIVTVNPDKDTFYPDINDFQSKINNNTSIVLINSPNNPTGVLYKENIIKNLCDILKAKEKEFGHPIYLISDEPYRELIYSDNKYPFITNYYDNSIITYSFSKSISIPGERIGYILVNPKANDSSKVYDAICGAARSLGYVCATTLFQYLIPHILGYTSDISIYKNNANLFYSNLTSIGYDVIKPDGAMYLFVKSLIDDDKAFSKKALEYNLLIVPSESFGIKGYVRLAYCVKEQQIINSIPKFKELYDYYSS